MNDIQLAIFFIHDLGLAILTNLFTLESLSDGAITISGALFFVTCYRTRRECKTPSIFDDDIHQVRQNWIKKINYYFRSLSAVKVMLFVFLCALAAGCADEDRTFLAIALLVIAVVSCALIYHTHPGMMPFNPTHSHADIEWLFHLNKKIIEPHLKKIVHFENVDRKIISEESRKYADNIHKIASKLGQDIKIATPMEVQKLIHELKNLGWKAERYPSKKTPYMTRFVVSWYRTKYGNYRFKEAWKSCKRLHQYYLIQVSVPSDLGHS